MLHVAYPGYDLRGELSMGPCADVNSYVAAILKTAYQASASLGPTPHSRRRFAFMAHSPSVCIALNWKQPNCKPGIVIYLLFCFWLVSLLLTETADRCSLLCDPWRSGPANRT
jgi:hypothetical protein